MTNDDELKIRCSKCKEEKYHTEFYDGIECFVCWETGINEAKVQELREQLTQYLDIDKAKLKAGLTLEQLKEVRKIISDNYVVGSDTIGGEASKKGGKELIVALWTSDGSKMGWQPSKCLEKIDLQIKNLKPAPEPQTELKTYTDVCPTCNEMFFCELEEGDTSEKEASNRLSEQINKHIKKVHEEEEKKKKKRERERERERTLTLMGKKLKMSFLLIKNPSKLTNLL
ncbi:hypothetical protein [endosymbiont GvMRE of Glomus versiforme]|uniref:hypothetical protein n=1 Tax=endosymbiont GvMRE of Glomus versiforme TaxID=2039283 RepID=UPI0011C35498|nr:hypothetical protein [endosymbiont GvMRE of Glomus versiforme]